MIASLKTFIPRLSTSLHKGDMGKLGVIGGSKDYTGAPYFSAISAMYCGADLVHVICPSGVSPIIKSYSPDLIVHPSLDQNITEASKWIERLHGCVIGPGLGINENTENATTLLKQLISSNKPIVIDADGFYLILRDPNLIKGYKKVILTPNVVEFGRLFKIVVGKDPSGADEDIQLLAEQLNGPTIVQKGRIDLMCNNETNIIKCTENGSPRRCGGQGDLLSGAMLTFFHWFCQAENGEQPLPYPASICAAFTACTLTRRCSHLAYSKHGRSMVTQDMIREIQSAFEQFFGRI